MVDKVGPILQLYMTNCITSRKMSFALNTHHMFHDVSPTKHMNTNTTKCVMTLYVLYIMTYMSSWV